MAGMGGGDEVTVNITGNSGGLQDAIDQGIGSFADLAAAIAKNGDMIVGALAPIQDMLTLLVGSLTEVGAQAAAAGDQMGAGLQSGAEEGASSLTLLQSAALGVGDAFAGFRGILQEFGVTGSGGLFDLFGNAVESVTGHLSSFMTQMWAVTGGMMAMQVFNQATSWVENFASGLVDLNNTMERTQTGWGYMFGQMVNGKDVTGVSQSLANWTKQYSMQLPFTRQDMLQAITMLAPMGLSEQGVKDFLPTLADLASTYGSAKGLDLQRTAMAIMGANFGITRMLRYDLMIDPRQLVQYGLQVTGNGMTERIANPQSLLPALQAFAKAKGLSGAAQYAATHTFWGLQSSWTDRLQNFQLDLGKGLFQGLEGDLKGVSEWWDKHHDQIEQLAQVFGKDLALGIHDATLAFQGFFQGLQNSALGQSVMQGFANAGKWLSDPKTQAQIKALGQTIGQDVGDTIKHIGDTLDAIKKSASDATAGLQNFGTGLSKIGINLDPWKLLQVAIENIGMLLGGLGTELGDIARILADIKNNDFVALGQDVIQFGKDSLQMSKDEIQAQANIVNAVTTQKKKATEDRPELYPTNKPHPKHAPAGERWVKGSDGYWHAVPIDSNGTGIGNIGAAVANVAGVLAGLSAHNPIPVQIAGVSSSAAQTIYGPSYRTSYGNVSQINNIFGSLGFQIQQLTAAIESKQSDANWAATHVAGLAGTIFGAIGGVI